jgi:CHAD domain-containing protein
LRWNCSKPCRCASTISARPISVTNCSWPSTATRLIKRGKGLADLDDHRRHRARIAAKKDRYASEFFASLCRRRAVQHYVEALTAPQDDLGWRNDAVVADQLLKALPRTSPETASGAAFARGFLASRVTADHQTLKKLWKRFNRLSPPH